MTTEPAEVDVVVAGSGAAGMTAALTAAQLGMTALVIEKTESFGGSTARSGGGIWAPGNAVLRKAGITDSPERASAYLAYVAGDCVPAELRRAFLEHGPAMLSLVLANTALRLAWVPGYADYYPEAPGGLARGRSIEPVPMDGRVLGGELAHLGRPYLPAVRQRVGPVRRRGARDVRREPRRTRTSRPGWSSTSATATGTCSPACRRASRSPAAGTPRVRSSARTTWPGSPGRPGSDPTGWSRT